jgi:anthranilate phosphoribosyltransferase
MSLLSQLRRVMEERDTLGRAEARGLMEEILRNAPAEMELAALLGAMAARGETAEEVAGFADAMRSAATALPLEAAERDALVDTCGTGGDASGTFNISTAAALVAAAAGATVAKHGNRAVTSRSGSADVLEALGIAVDLTAAEAAEALRRYGFAFLHAPSMHPAMRAVMPVRRGLGVRTVFNLLGPLTNPAGASRQVVGVYVRRQVAVVAEALALLGTQHALVVHGKTENRGMDELSISGESEVAEVRGGQVRWRTLTPEDVGIGRAPVSELAGGDPEWNAGLLLAVFAGERGPRRDVVLLNAAAVLVTADRAVDLRAGVARAAEVIDSGAVTALIAELQGCRSAA